MKTLTNRAESRSRCAQILPPPPPREFKSFVRVSARVWRGRAMNAAAAKCAAMLAATTLIALTTPANAQTLSANLVAANADAITVAWQLTPPETAARVHVAIQHDGITDTNCMRSDFTGGTGQRFSLPASATSPIRLETGVTSSATAVITTAEYAAGEILCVRVFVQGNNDAEAFLAVTAADFGSGDGSGGSVADEAVLPNVLRQIPHGIHGGIYKRIEERQRRDRRWQ